MTGPTLGARRTTGGLVLAIVVLAAVVVAELLSGPIETPVYAEPETAAEPTAAAAEIPPPDRAIPPIEAYAAVAERPLFLQGRRPLPESTAAAAPEARGLPELKGVILTSDMTAAMFEVAGQPGYTIVAVGDQFGSWQLDEVNPDNVVLSNSNASHVLEIKDKDQPRRRTRRQDRAQAPAAAGGEAATAPALAPDANQSAEGEPPKSQQSGD